MRRSAHKKRPSLPILTSKLAPEYDFYAHQSNILFIVDDKSFLTQDVFFPTRPATGLSLVMIEVQDVTKRFGNLIAIDRISFSVDQGEILAFLGPNGAGKTTTIRILTCFTPASEGVVRVAGFDCFDDSLEVKKHIGYLPEHPPLYHELTVSEYLTFVGRMKGLTFQSLRQRMDIVVEQIGLGEVRHRVIGNLSRGFSQRVGLAQALLHDPPVLILDEPTVGLDPKQILEMRELIRSLAGAHTIILSTHILPEATALCQRVIILNHGRIVAVDSPDQLSARLRRSEKVRLLLNGSPSGFASRLSALSGVLYVLQGPSSNQYLVECERGRDIREDLARFVVNQGIGLLELKTISMSLEDVFWRLIQHEEHIEDSNDSSPPTRSMASQVITQPEA